MAGSREAEGKISVQSPGNKGCEMKAEKKQGGGQSEVRPGAKSKGTRPVGAGCGEAEQGWPRDKQRHGSSQVPYLLKCVCVCGGGIITSTFRFRMPRGEKDLFNQHLDGLTRM